jgi:hypothetical protein
MEMEGLHVYGIALEVQRFTLVSDCTSMYICMYARRYNTFARSHISRGPESTAASLQSCGMIHFLPLLARLMLENVVVAKMTLGCQLSNCLCTLHASFDSPCLVILC